MGMKDITAGDKVAKARGMRLIKSKAGKLGMEVAFEFIEPTTSALEHLNWVGWLSEKAQERTMETLVEILDYNGSEQMDSNSVFTDPNVLNYKKEVKLVVEIEESVSEKDGKTYYNPKIKWVNNIGGSGFAGAEVSTVKSDLQAVGFKAAFLAARKKANKPTNEVKNHAEPFFNKDETVPF